MKYLIDANIFLHVALKQEKEGACKEFLDEVSSGEIEAAVTLFHMDASAVIMQNRGMSQNEVGNFYFEAYSSKGLEIIHTGVSTRLNALANKNHSGLDDSLVSRALEELDVEKVVTYDTDFSDEKRVTPEEVLENTA